VTAVVENGTAPDTDFKVVFVLYKNGGTLKISHVPDDGAARLAEGLPSAEYELTFTGADAAADRVKLFLWDGTGDPEPLDSIYTMIIE